MVGSDRAKEALAMMALHETLRNVCVNSEWTYSVFWTIRPRPRSRGGTGCKVGEENGSLMLMWEDGFCRSSKSRANRVPGLFNGNGNGIGMDKMVKSPSYDCLEELDADDPVRKAFRKMSIQLYNYGEGLMGKVASDKCHKWVFKEPTDCEAGISNYWQSSFDAHPPEWTDQFASGIQTIAVIQAGHGLLQLGSCKIIPEDLHFVLRMRHMFESLGYQSGFYLSQLFAGTRNGSANNNKPTVSPRPPLFNWSHRPLPAFPSPRHGLGLINHQSKDESQFLLNNATAAALNNNTSTDSLITHQVLSSLCNQESGCADIKWPNGLSYFTALTTDSKLFFNSENFSESSAEMGLPRMPNTPKHPSPFVARNSQPPSPGMIPTTNANVNHVNCKTSSEAAATNLQAHSHFEGGISEYLSLEGPQTLDRYALPRKMHSGSRLDHKFKRSFTLPARMPSPAQEEHHQQQDHRHEQETELEPEQHPCTMDYSMNDSAIRHSEVGHIYSDLMETFLE